MLVRAGHSLRPRQQLATGPAARRNVDLRMASRWRADKSIGGGRRTHPTRRGIPGNPAEQ